MPSLQVVRPDIPIDSDAWLGLQAYLNAHWIRARDGRAGQVDDDYTRWTKNYAAQPREAVRTLPWPNASNIVVPLIRIFLDTFIARTTNLVFSARPLYVVEGFDREVQEALAHYLNYKALHCWGHYDFFDNGIGRGNKYGTVVSKSIWLEDIVYSREFVEGGEHDVRVVRYDDVKTKCVPFEDFYVFPITANDLSEVEIRFCRSRWTEEAAKQAIANSRWKLGEDELESALVEAGSSRRAEVEAESQVSDAELRELHAIECYLDRDLGDGRKFQIVGVLLPSLGRLVDCYYFPYPVEIFNAYRPFPRDDFFYGESMAQVLEQLQEEASVIHNDRRNNSYIANAPLFKKKSGVLHPTIGVTWYPGKTIELEDMNDFEAINVGRNYDDMLDQEMNVFQLAERTIGLGPVMQGYAQGMMGKRGIYNAQGTLALLSESNRRQDTSIRRAREWLGAVGRTSFGIQLGMKGYADPSLEAMPEKMREMLEKTLPTLDARRINQRGFSIRSSSASVNKEVERQNLLQIANVLAQYSNSVQGFVVQLLNPKINPGLRAIMLSIVESHKWMATRLARAFDEFDAEEVFPDIVSALEAAGIQQPNELGELERSGGGGAAEPITREFLENIQALPTAAAVAGGEGNLG